MSYLGTTFQQYYRRRVDQPEIYPNLLMGVLGASPPPINAGAVLNAQYDWPNPPPRKRAVPDEPFLNNFLIGNLAALPALPFQQYSTDNPPPPRPPPQLQPFVNLYLTAGAVTFAPLPFIPYDWVNPRVDVQKWLEPQSHRSLSYYYPVPFSSPEWPNPLRSKAAPQIVEYPNLLLKGIPAYPAFIAQYDWPNPPRKPRYPPDEIYPNLILNATAPVYPNFIRQTDWPNPLRARPVPYVEPSPNLLLSGLLPSQAALPFLQMDWPNPLRSRVTFQAELPPNLVLTFGGITPPPPTAPGLPGRFGGRVITTPKKVGETRGVPVDFISALGAGETITSASVVCTVYSGVDPNPQSMVSGGATVSGTIVTQMMTGGVAGTVYDLLYKATTSRAEIVEIATYLAVETDLP